MSFKIKFNCLRRNKSFFSLIRDKQNFKLGGIYYKVIACFYEEICNIYKIYVLHKFIAQMKIPARIRSESGSMA